MRAEYNVELGREDHCLEVPWGSPIGSPRFLDLRSQPELLLEISEAHDNRELGEFLASVNRPSSLVQTAKCDTWSTNELDVEEEVFGSLWKYGSYIDFIFADERRHLSFEEHERFAEDLIKLLSKAPDLASGVELCLRRCYYHRGQPPDMEKSEDGFCASLYLFGYGDDEDGARANWAIGLNLAKNALLQLSATKVKIS